MGSDRKNKKKHWLPAHANHISKQMSMHCSMLAASYWMLASSWQGQTLLLTNVSEAPQSFPPCHHTVHEPFGRTCGADASPTESETITDITHLISVHQKTARCTKYIHCFERSCHVPSIAINCVNEAYQSLPAFTMPYL